MLNKERIIEFLETLHEHKMAKDIFVPLFQKMGLRDVRFTGGADEEGIDIEYYELTEPEKRKSYVGIQFKKGSLVYSSGGSKNSVKEVRNQAEEAFEKEIPDIDGHATQFISRFIVAVTGDINQRARKFIGRARQKGADRRIDYWTGDRLAEYIQGHWIEKFEEYFSDEIEQLADEGGTEETIIDAEYLYDNYKNIIIKCKKVKTTLGGFEWQIIESIFKLSYESGFESSVPIVDLLIELECTEDYCREEFEHLVSLGYLDFERGAVSLTGHANIFTQLLDAITEELDDAEEDPDNTWGLFNSLIK